MAGVALGNINRRFAWQPSFRVAGVALMPLGTCSLCVAGVALGDIHLRFAWQAWYWTGAAALCVAGVALAHIDRRFAWQAWHLLTPTFVSRGRRGTYATGLALVVRLGAVSCPGRRATLRGRRGAWRH